MTIGVFVNPGRTPDQKEASSSDWGDRVNNRATEYNELNDRYARMIVEELIPTLKKDYAISDNPDDRAPLPGPVPGRSVRSPSRGSVRTSFTRSSAPSGVSPTSAADMSIPTW